MPNRPPYPREARVVAVEKGPQGQTVTGISSVRIILSLIRLSANILPSRKPWMPNGVMKILTSRNPLSPNCPPCWQYRAYLTFLFISRTNEYLTHGFFRHGASARQSLHSTAAWSCYASRRLIFTHRGRMLCVESLC